MPVQPTKLYVPQTPDELDQPMTEEMQAILTRKLKALEELLAEQGKAAFKLELIFGKARSIHRPTPGMLSFFESGRKLHGGGDAKVYMCPGIWKDPQTGEVTGKGPCDAVIPDSSHGLGHLVCPKCKEVWKEHQVYGEILARLPMQHWAVLLTRYYARLGCNADVVLKFSEDDIRSKALLEQQKQKGGELLGATRAKRRRAASIYPLRNIIKDTSAGQDLAKKFYDFVRA